MEKYKELLFLARSVLESHYKGEQVEISEEVKERYGGKGACFVTLTIGGELRGCIGSLIASQELYKDVIENVLGAGFRDPRFIPLLEEELDEIRIELSVLSEPIKLGIGEEVIDKIDNSMGIVLNKGGFSATFLPQVWEQIPEREVFLEELSEKAGLFRDDWKTAELEYYKVEKVVEE